MATLRSHTRIDRSPDEVWAVLSDAGAISEWFTGCREVVVDRDQPLL